MKSSKSMLENIIQYVIKEYVRTIESSIDTKSLSQVRQVHAHLITASFFPFPCISLFVENSLMEIYAKSGSTQDARQVFDKMPTREISSWNTLLSAFAKYGEMGDACQVFDKMPTRNASSWTAMISGYSKNGRPHDVLGMFGQMISSGCRPNDTSFSKALWSCGCLEGLYEGKQVHGYAIRTGFDNYMFVGSALVDMYGKCRRTEDAKQVFDTMPEKGCVGWTSMMMGYAHNRQGEEALQLFSQMHRNNVRRDESVFISALISCGCSGTVVQGRAIHCQIVALGFQRDSYVSVSLVDMYSKCGAVHDAQKMFNRMRHRNVVSWTAMIGGYSQNGYYADSVRLFRKMLSSNVSPNGYTFAGILSSCSCLAMLDVGRQLHAHVIQSGFQSFLSVTNALVAMYAKCGNVEDATLVFHSIVQKDIVSWNTMIIGYGLNGYGKEASKLFQQMLNAGFQPTEISFLGILSACSHAGLAEEGQRFFDLMRHGYKLPLKMDHFACMIDLLGRAGKFDEAMDLINNMTVAADSIVWKTLLGACRIHGNVKVGEYVAEKLMQFDGHSASVYVLLANVYSAAGKWDKVAKVRKLLKESGHKKIVGCSWIEIKDKVYTFKAEDCSLQESQEIYAMIEKLTLQMKEAGYIPDTNYVLQDLEEEIKQKKISYHSEKLAIAFGLIKTCPGTSIRIFKNLRVCGDCHTAFKFISKLTARKIILRDISRFHHFQGGLCSCKDYW